jgi:hypothetical protein
MGTENESGAEIRAPFGKVKSSRSAEVGENGILRNWIAGAVHAGAGKRFRQL